jgi:hypothetical protein
MATSKKITELTAITSAANSDLLYIVHDPAGVPASNKITVTNFIKGTVTVGAAPASNTAAGNQGYMIANGAYLYICTAANTWVRIAATTSW